MRKKKGTRVEFWSRHNGVERRTAVIWDAEERKETATDADASFQTLPVATVSHSHEFMGIYGHPLLSFTKPCSEFEDHTSEAETRERRVTVAVYDPTTEKGKRGKNAKQLMVACKFRSSSCIQLTSSDVLRERLPLHPHCLRFSVSFFGCMISASEKQENRASSSMLPLLLQRRERPRTQTHISTRTPGNITVTAGREDHPHSSRPHPLHPVLHPPPTSFLSHCCCNCSRLTHTISDSHRDPHYESEFVQFEGSEA